MPTLEDLPPAWFVQFDGEGLEAKTGVSAVLATVDGDGWPHLAFLSAGEILVRESRIAMALWPSSTTAAALRRDGRAVLYAASDGAAWETRLTCRPADAGPEQLGLSMFLGRIGDVRRHKPPYAEVEGLVEFRLLQAAESVDRWRRQLVLLRKIIA